MTEENIKNIKQNIGQGKDSVAEMKNLMDQYKQAGTSQERAMIKTQIDSLKSSLQKSTKVVSQNLDKVSIAKPLASSTIQQPVKELIQGQTTPVELPRLKMGKESKELDFLERETLKKLMKKDKKKVVKKQRKASSYVKFVNKMFSEKANKLQDAKMFKDLERSIVRAKLSFIPSSYISVIFFTTLVSFFIALLLFLFFLFFNIEVTLPIITKATENIAIRFLKVVWILIGLPIATFLMMYVYPSMEEKSMGRKIDTELPFATIHMSAISGSMIDPSKIFSIIVGTKEYPFLEKEFKKLIAEIDIYGYDLVTALKNIAYNSSSKKLAELLTGLATTINSGGNLPDFFDKRAQTLLFDYKLSREKYAKSAETMMDVYISVVIAAPMIFMLLLMMMRISGLGLALATSTITLMTILGVVIINIVFLTFLHLKQPT